MILRKRIAFYGGSFDPVHRGHLAIAKKITDLFFLDKFVFVPAFHAPHKRRKKPTSGFDRYAMLCLATNGERKISVSKIELEVPERPYTLQTLIRIREELPDMQIFFVMGADSWEEITTWHEWERVLSITNHIVVTRPDYEMKTDHVTEMIRERIVDLRGSGKTDTLETDSPRIYFTDAVNLDISATEIREKIRENKSSWRDDLTEEVANYVEKYQIYN